MSRVTIHPWQPAPSDWSISDNHVLVFRIDLSTRYTAEDHSVLSDAERSRAAQFRFDEHRDRWILCRSALRRLLGHATNASPADVPITYNAHGKPCLLDATIEFNVSHSQDIAVIAVASNCEVGIDVEVLNDAPDIPAISRHFFTPAEQSFLTSGPRETLVTRFYQCWTRKEAFLKSLGHGLLQPLEDFDISPTLASVVSTHSPSHVAPALARLFVEIRTSDTSIATLVTDPEVNAVHLYFLAD
jgi:4'-phosphopantetheinyl transferase